MNVLHSLDALPSDCRQVCLAIGVFDGVHLGHQKLITTVRDDARAVAGTSVVMTFDPHPARVLHPGKAPPLLTSTDHKLHLIGQLSPDVCMVIPFTLEFAGTEPEAFVESLHQQNRQLHEICVGTRFRFGHNRAGDARLLESLAPRYGYTAKEIGSVNLGDEIISSTAVRQAVQRGDLERADGMLGRRFSVLGTVVDGDHRGQKLGFPTANLSLHNEVLPPDGVYAVGVILGETKLGGVANLGMRPTFAGRETRRVLEVHILDFAREIYGEKLEVIFVNRLRDERRYESVEALRRQITSDLVTTRRIIGKIVAHEA